MHGRKEKEITREMVTCCRVHVPHHHVRLQQHLLRAGEVVRRGSSSWRLQQRLLCAASSDRQVPRPRVESWLLRAAGHHGPAPRPLLRAAAAAPGHACKTKKTGEKMGVR